MACDVELRDKREAQVICNYHHWCGTSSQVHAGRAAGWLMKKRKGCWWEYSITALGSGN